MAESTGNGIETFVGNLIFLPMKYSNQMPNIDISRDILGFILYYQISKLYLELIRVRFLKNTFARW